MPKNRLEAFSDGVLAIIITIMVLELHAPEEPTWPALLGVLPVFLSYVLSFLYLGIYWNNHHHMIHLASRINGTALWANLHLLFWLSLFPFTTAWMQDTGFQQVPVLVYGANLLLASVAFGLLRTVLIRVQGPDGHLARATGRERKARISPLLYLTGIAATLVHPGYGLAVYAGVALIWLVPDRRIERYASHHG